MEHDGINDMVIGAVWCPQEKLKEINRRLRDIKIRNGISPTAELKWTKISPAKVRAYEDIIDYFFDDDDLHFRAIIIPDKSKLNHQAFHQTHDEWYYKMYFDMLKVRQSATMCRRTSNCVIPGRPSGRRGNPFSGKNGSKHAVFGEYGLPHQ